MGRALQDEFPDAGRAMARIPRPISPAPPGGRPTTPPPCSSSSRSSWHLAGDGGAGRPRLSLDPRHGAGRQGRRCDVSHPDPP